MNLAAAGHSALPIVSEDEERAGHEEDLAPGGDYVKLLLLAKPFSPTFRENWELYRTEYWDRENERRALIRAKLKERTRLDARRGARWFWWLPWRRGQMAVATATEVGEKALQQHQHQHPHHRHGAGAAAAAVTDREHKRTRSSSVRRGSMSGTSSRSPTPTVEMDEGAVARKAITASNASDKRRKKVPSASTPRSQKRPVAESRSITPEMPSPLAKESSFSSVASSGSTADTGRVLRNSSSKKS